MSIATTTASAIRQLGWLNGLLYLAARSLGSASAGRCRIVKYYFVAQPVPAEPLAPTARATATPIKRIFAGDTIVQRFPRPKAVIARRFADGAVCYGAIKNDELVGFIWLKQNEYMEDEVRCLYRLEPPGAAAWDFDVYVEPAHRLGRTFVRLWDAANAFLREHGHRWSISRISAFNPTSLAAHERLGCRRIASGTFVMVGAVQFTVLSCFPYLHVGLSTRRHPILTLTAPESHKPA